MKAVITGGCSGLGLSFTKYLLSLNYEVYALYNKSVDAATSLQDEYPNLKVLKCDIRNEDEVKNVINEIDHIDLLINNAATCMDNSYIDKSKDEFMNTLEVNLVGVFLMIKHALLKMDNGIIINISSNNTLGNNSPLSMDYDASKAGVNILTKDFSEVISSKIIAICPGWIKTKSILEMNQDYLNNEMKKVNQKKLIEPDDLAKYIIDNKENYQTGDIIEIKEL